MNSLGHFLDDYYLENPEQLDFLNIESTFSTNLIDQFPDFSEIIAITNATKEWLGVEKINKFKRLKKEWGIIISEFCPPIEGKEQIKNFLKRSGLCTYWNEEDYDIHWLTVLELALLEDLPSFLKSIFSYVNYDELILPPSDLDDLYFNDFYLELDENIEELIEDSLELSLEIDQEINSILESEELNSFLSVEVDFDHRLGVKII